MKPTVSVIVPVYQVEDYLWSCLDSLSAQTQEGIEILLIDDGSTDLSGRICDQYAAADGRFRCSESRHRPGRRAIPDVCRQRRLGGKGLL